MLKRLSVENWLSFLAVTIAALALIASMWQSFLFRRHNELSVRPLIEIEYHTEGRSANRVISLYAKNEGLGPAIVQSNSFLLKGNVLTEDEVYTIVRNLCSWRTIQTKLLTRGTVIRPADAISLFMFDEANLHCPNFKKPYERFLALVVQIQYESLYKERFVAKKSLREIFPKLAQQVAQDNAR